MQNSENTFLQAFSGLINENISYELLPIGSSQTTCESVANVAMLPARTSVHHTYTDLNEQSAPEENLYTYTESDGISQLKTGENQDDPLLTLLKDWNLAKLYNHFKGIIK